MYWSAARESHSLEPQGIGFTDRPAYFNGLAADNKCLFFKENKQNSSGWRLTLCKSRLGATPLHWTVCTPLVDYWILPLYRGLLTVCPSDESLLYPLFGCCIFGRVRDSQRRDGCGWRICTSAFWL